MTITFKKVKKTYLEMVDTITQQEAQGDVN